MIEIIGIGSSVLVVAPLVAMPRLAAAYSHQEPEQSKPRRKYHKVPAGSHFIPPSTPTASELAASQA